VFRKQRQKIVLGEGGKATFWVTFFYWVRTDGQFPIPPTVVHEGGELAALFAMHLPSDWCIHAAPSGYMDRDGWFKIAHHFLRWCGPKRPLYLFFDAHDSHWDPDALKLWLDNQIHTFFTKSHGSDEDCINDNGLNAKWHSIIETMDAQEPGHHVWSVCVWWGG
jgi:hypothetical protein